MEARGCRRIFLWCFERGWLCSYVKVDREPEAFMARAPSGKQEVRWIQFDSFFEFQLRTKKHSKLLAKLEVTRDD
jgi:hypothetical protein